MPDVHFVKNLIINVLIGLVQKNRIARDPTQPIFIHLDQTFANNKYGNTVAQKYEKLFEELEADASITALRNENKLYIIRTQTHGLDIRNPEALKTEFL